MDLEDKSSINLDQEKKKSTQLEKDVEELNKKLKSGCLGMFR